MKFRLILLMLFLFLGGNLAAQTILTGVVTDSKNAPIPYASVYLSKTTVGVLTNDNGAYSLTIPQDGFYELICSCVGYETNFQMIKADGSPIKMNLQLPEHIVQIDEVAVKGKDRNRKENYAQFLNCFIGHTRHSSLCRIKNPEDLVVYRTSNDSNLVAYSVKPLIIKNLSFGYQINYDLLQFNYNLKTNRLRFAGNYYFQDITNQKRENERIKNNRLTAYYGSRMHFLRALFSGSIQQESFVINQTQTDSSGNRTIVSDTIPETHLKVALDSESMTLYHDLPLVVIYRDNHPELFSDVLEVRTRKRTSVMVVSDSVKVYKNGYYPEGYNLSWGGNMSRDRVAELLPFDFVPKPLRKTMKTNF